MHKLLDKVFGKKEYMDWQEYENRINFMDQFYWSQGIRRKSLES